MEKLIGKTITIIGPPAVGKTFLVDRLKNNLGINSIKEFNSGVIPENIRFNLKYRKNLFHTLLWFRNNQIGNHLEAIKRSKDKLTIIDTPFYLYRFYVDFYINDEFEKSILKEMFELDWKSLNQSDVTIYIRSSEELIKIYLKRRKGLRDWENTKDWPNFISKVHYEFEKNIEIIKPKNLKIVINKILKYI
jgi:deoxyadenosine/deoxycytidine kinase